MEKNILFKTKVPLEYLLQYLDEVCKNKGDYFMIDKIVYKIMMDSKQYKTFIETILPYYYDSKKYFVTRKLTYTSFGNIIRQICHSHGHPFMTDTKYNHSEYTIRYIIDKNVNH